MNKDFLKIMMIAGEASGDIHGGAIAAEIKRRAPSAQLFGIGGDSMRQAGVDLSHHVRDLGVTGFTEVVRKLGKIMSVMRSVVKIAKSERPDAVILIDYPDFNLRLAAKLKAVGMHVIYYVSPQLWAWRSGRINTIQKYVDRLLVLFPFERDWYANRGIDVAFVGNPILDRIRSAPSRAQCRAQLGYPEKSPHICMLPGSRMNELERHLPVFIAASEQFSKLNPATRFSILCAPTIPKSTIEHYTESAMIPIAIHEEDSPIVLKSADFAWVASGTATLETAICETPFLIVYKTSWISYWIAKFLIHVDYIGIVNVAAGRLVIPELIQEKCNPDQICFETNRYLSDPEALQLAKREIFSIVSSFGESGAARRAVDEILKQCGWNDRS